MTNFRKRNATHNLVVQKTESAGSVSKPAEYEKRKPLLGCRKQTYLIDTILKTMHRSNKTIYSTNTNIILTTYFRFNLLVCY